jgi:hypothetical protein
MALVIRSAISSCVVSLIPRISFPAFDFAHSRARVLSISKETPVTISFWILCSVYPCHDTYEDTLISTISSSISPISSWDIFWRLTD